MSRYVLFPIVDKPAWDSYKSLVNGFWLGSEFIITTPYKEDLYQLCKYSINNLFDGLDEYFEKDTSLENTYSLGFNRMMECVHYNHLNRVIKTLQKDPIKPAVWKPRITNVFDSVCRYELRTSVYEYMSCLNNGIFDNIIIDRDNMFSIYCKLMSDKIPSDKKSIVYNEALKILNFVDELESVEASVFGDLYLSKRINRICKME